MLFAFDGRFRVSRRHFCFRQDQAGVNKNLTSRDAAHLSFYGKNPIMWSWVPYFRFSLPATGSSGDQH